MRVKIIYKDEWAMQTTIPEMNVQEAHTYILSNFQGAVSFAVIEPVKNVLFSKNIIK